MENKEKNITSWEYIIQTKKEYIDFINKVIEAYDGLGNVRTLDNQSGLIKILTNSYLLDDMDKAIETLKQKNIEMEVLEKREWLGVL
ncbi:MULTISPECIES: DUF4911 domain-containing protein [Leptotrichia]|jgi:hypothetical protein cdivTM_02291|uniref:DUF4911 domain-containing protein n=1 Tax=Leptotrichia wadei TaxID=157687 RepID=A0A510KTH6_9FUSO|nr:MULTISPECIES: DUF4911 domain-containing protein [Leptotrichia]MBS6018916.1 DUF4911 domain-containing protein [Leptotrichia wadei]NWO26971.1 DUF4911 domain-containing protein [Leptotrichia sp. oral taxon 417]BBM54547.1 hypothetical protein JMUB3936_0831 [Leptotrichia wadei]VTX63077.1 Uncharacterised protein [uncultured Leptotrichia sp.]